MNGVFEHINQSFSIGLTPTYVKVLGSVMKSEKRDILHFKNCSGWYEKNGLAFFSTDHPEQGDK